MKPRRCPIWVPALVLVLTVAQLIVAVAVPGIERFEGKAFEYRLAFYPLLMLFVPAVWWYVARRAEPPPDPPYGAFALVMAPFLIDITGNSLNLYDTVDWWDNFNHFANWLLLLTGIGLIICGGVRPRWAVVVVITGAGAILAIGWEAAEWYGFIRQGTELEGAYENTLSDEVLGTLGALLAGLIVLRRNDSPD